MAGINIKKYKVPTARKTEKPKAASNFWDFLNKDISLFGGGMSNAKKERFYSELGVLLSSGVDIRSALELIADEQSKRKEKEMLEEIREKIVQGSSLSVALQESGQFTPYEYYSLQIGEETGKIMPVLEELTDFFARQVKQRRQMVSAFTYPVFVLTAALGAVFFMLRFMVPMFGDVYKRFGGDLPWLTQKVLALSDSISGNLWYAIVGILVVVILVFTQRKKTWFRKVAANVMRRLWIFGPMIEKVYLARFCSSMSLLIGAKVPMLRAIELMEQMISYYPIEVALKDIRERILKGLPLHECMAGHRIFNKRLVSLVKVGEEVNELEKMFNRLSTQYSDEVEHQTSLISNLLEPALIIFIGGIVAVILVAMYLPLFELSFNFK